MPPVLQPVMRTDLALLGAISLFFWRLEDNKSRVFSRNYPSRRSFRPFMLHFLRFLDSVPDLCAIQSDNAKLPTF